MHLQLFGVHYLSSRQHYPLQKKSPILILSSYLRRLPHEVGHMPIDPQQYRELFPHIRHGIVSLNHAATAPYSRPVLTAV